LIRTNTPGSRFRIVLSDYRRGGPKNYGVVGDASRYERVDCDNAISAYCQLSTRAQDGRPAADPRALANSDLAIPRNTLIDDWYSDIFVRVIVVLNDDLLADEHITF
jgi:hypothetical protein